MKNNAGDALNLTSKLFIFIFLGSVISLDVMPAKARFHISISCIYAHKPTNIVVF